MKLHNDIGRSPSQSTGPIRIEVSPTLAKVSGHLSRAALDALTEVVLDRTYELGQGYIYRHVLDELFTREDGGRLVTLPGLVPRLVRELQRLDLPFTLDDHLDRDGRSPVVKPPDGYDDPYDEDFAQVIGRNPRGQIVVGSLGEVIEYIARLGKLFADQHVVVVASSRKRIRLIRDRVRRLLTRPVTDDPETVWRSGRRFLICTPYIYNLCQLHDWQVVIFADQESVGAKLSLDQIPELGPCQRYALVRESRHRDASDQLRLEAATGEVIYHSPTVASPNGRVSGSATRSVKADADWRSFDRPAGTGSCGSR